MDILFWIIAAVLVLAGIVGIVLPALPGPILVFAGLVLAAWANQFTIVGGSTIVLLAVLTVLAYGVEFAASALGARQFGATPRGIIGAAVGTAVGIFFGLPGIILGPFLGAVAGELSARQNLPKASRAGFGTWIGIIAGIAVELTLVFVMLGIFATALIF